MTTPPTFRPEYVALLRLAYVLLKERRFGDARACLEGALTVAPTSLPHEEASVRFELGKLFFYHSNERRKAKEHFERAHQLYCSVGVVNSELILLLGRICIGEKAFDAAIALLRGGLEYFRDDRGRACLMTLMAKAHVGKGDVADACGDYRRGSEMAEKLKDGHSLRLLCQLGEAQCLVTRERHAEALHILTKCSAYITAHEVGEERRQLLISCLTLKALSLLLTGEAKEAMKCLKQLQGIFGKDAGSQGEVSHIGWYEWMKEDELIILVYLAHLLHSLQTGSTEKALKYTDKAVNHFKKLKDESPLAITLMSHVVQLKAVCQLIRGKYSLMVNDLSQLSLMYQKPNVSSSYRASFHLLLGLYALAVDHLEWAKSHFRAVLETSRDCHARHIALLNVIVQHLKEGKFDEATSLIAEAEKSQVGIAHRVGIDYVEGLANYCRYGRLEDGKLQSALVKANDRGLRRITSSSLLLLGQIFWHQGNADNSERMLFPALDEATKIPDKVQELRCCQMIELFYERNKNAEMTQRFAQRGKSLAQELATERKAAVQCQEHFSLIKWGTEVGSTTVATATAAATIAEPVQKKKRKAQLVTATVSPSKKVMVAATVPSSKKVIATAAAAATMSPSKKAIAAAAATLTPPKTDNDRKPIPSATQSSPLVHQLSGLDSARRSSLTRRPIRDEAWNRMPDAPSFQQQQSYFHPSLASGLHHPAFSVGQPVQISPYSVPAFAVHSPGRASAFPVQQQTVPIATSLGSHLPLHHLPQQPHGIPQVTVRPQHEVPQVAVRTRRYDQQQYQQQQHHHQPAFPYQPNYQYPGYRF
ncbi:MAU2 chromatid cohesion factor homolog isoform X2 [Oscarella lobularis]|uniref:MAU2 chromatid cohesion factor homolog isoform X2 n=1 Tax=Oscarella lobularis TaxID=121494 RepID=UPI0033136154